ncbi:MAG TPA: polyprenol monophosphomannose synthase [Polyangia bacterium]|nr:polyprenol monophosphomannose synthase [Polyangia bacterium]
MQGAPTVIIIPTYNERDCLRQIVPAVRAAAPDADVLIVDDNSPDGTGQLADELAAADQRVQVLHRAHKQGLGAAYLSAFLFALDSDRGAKWKRIVQMDADFSHDPADVPRLLAALDAGADLAIGSRYVEGGGTENWGLGRRVISRGGGAYARTVLGVGIQDLTAGFKAWKAETLRGIDLNAVSAKGYGFQIEMTFRALRNGFKVTEVPIRFIDRRVGQSKMSGTIFFEALTLVWSLRMRIPPSRG